MDEQRLERVGVVRLKEWLRARPFSIRCGEYPYEISWLDLVQMKEKAIKMKDR